MNMAAFLVALAGALVTFAGFGFARKFGSGVLSALVRMLAVVAGFFSLLAIESVLKIKDASASGGYWVYMLVGGWLISRLFKGSGPEDR